MLEVILKPLLLNENRVKTYVFLFNRLDQNPLLVFIERDERRLVVKSSAVGFAAQRLPRFFEFVFLECNTNFD